MANPIKDLIESTINSLDGMFTSESILGETVTAPDGTMIIPVLITNLSRELASIYSTNAAIASFAE